MTTTPAATTEPKPDERADWTRKIYVVAPTDPSQELAAFVDEEDAERFAATFEAGGRDGLGTAVEEVILCSGKTAQQLTIDRRQSQYDDIDETSVEEIPSEDLGRYVVSCGSAEGRREHVHVTGEDEDEVLERAARLIEDGWIPNEIHDLNTGDARRLDITTAVRIIEEPGR